MTSQQGCAGRRKTPKSGPTASVTDGAAAAKGTRSGAVLVVREHRKS